MLENKKSQSVRTLKITSSNGVILKMLIGDKETFDIKASGSPTSNCQLSTILNFNELIDTLSITELTTYIESILSTGSYLKLLIITNKTRYIKFQESFKNVKNKKIYLLKESKVKNRNQYIILLKSK